MSYIKKEAEKKGKGKVDLLVTSPGWHSKVERPDPMECGNVIHFTFSRLVEERGGTYSHTRDNPLIQTLETVVISLDLANRVSFGIHRIGQHIAQTDYDVSNNVHVQAYVRKVRGASTVEEIDAVIGYKEDTTFIPGLSHNGWAAAQSMLNELRDQRIMNRSAKPRKDRNQKFKDDIVDVAIGQIASRVNAIMNDILYWGDMASVQNFSPDTMVHC